MGTDAAAGDWGNNGANQGSGGSIRNIIRLEVRGPSGPQFLVDGPSGQLDFVLRTLWALRPCDPRNDVVSMRCAW